MATPTNVTVQNLVIEKYDPPIQNGAIQGGQGWTIQDNEVRLNYAVGITGRDGSKLIGNYVHDNGQMGLGGSGNNILVQGNEIAKNGYWSGIDVNWEGGGFKFANTDNLVVRGNYSHDNNGSGMWTDIDNIHTLYEDNVVVHNTGAVSAMRSAMTRSSATTLSSAMGPAIRAVGGGGMKSRSKTPVTLTSMATGLT